MHICALTVTCTVHLIRMGCYKWGYEISYKKTLDGKHKALRHLVGDFSQSYTELPCLFLALEQANPGCVVIWKTFDSNMSNTKIFQRVF